MKIAVTGAAGQIGLPLVLELIRIGHSVRVLIHKSGRGLEDLPLEIVNGDLLDQDKCHELCQGIEAVFHVAGSVSINGDSHGTVWKTNVLGTQNILDACVRQGVKKLIHFSSVHAYSSKPSGGIFDEKRPLNINSSTIYDQSKAEGQKRVMDYVSRHGLNATILNPTGVLGFPDYQPSIKGKMFIDFYNGNIPALTPGGFDWIDVRDVVRSAVNALEKGRSGEAYILSGQYYTIKELAELIGTITGKNMPRVVLPFWTLRLLLPLINVYSKLTKTQPYYTNESLTTLQLGHKNILSTKAAKELNHHVRPIEETIRDTYAWLKENNYIR